MNERHLSDDRLIEICVAGTPMAAEGVHLVECAQCEQRRVSIVQILGEIEEAATADADAAFPPGRLERQQARIALRIEQDGRPGRVLTFPATPPTFTTRARPHMRWAAAAAAAAFFVGMVAGHLVHELPREDQPPTGIVMVGNEADAAALRPVSTTFSEDEFLGQIELAAGRNGPDALRPLDDMTPRAWEVW